MLGILLWAIEGWKRLRARGKFVQPRSSAHLIDDLEDLASPVRAWVRERCVLVGDVKDPSDRKQCITLCDSAFADFKAWCESQEQKMVPTKTRFGTDLGTIGDIARVRATTEQLGILRDLGQTTLVERPWIYNGLRMKTKDDVAAEDAVS